MFDSRIRVGKQRVRRGGGRGGRDVPFDSEVHEPTPTGVFVHLHRVPGYPAVFTILDGDPEVVERPE